MIKQRQSNFEALKILGMLMILAHHFVAKNGFAVDSEIMGITFNKVFLQFIGNHAFVGNNLFFLVSAWFLYDAGSNFSLQNSLRKIWRLERQMLFWSLVLLAVCAGGGQWSLTMVIKSIFPLSTNLWWYPTTYAVFLLICPYYHKAMKGFEKSIVKRWMAIMFCIWSASTLVPFFEYGASNMCAFVMLYTVVFYIKEFKPVILSNKKLWRGIILIGYSIGFISVVILDVVGTKMQAAAYYACYYLRGNYRVLPMLISVSIFILATQWKIRSKFINTVAVTTFGVYLIHMYPWVQQKLFGEVLSLEKWISNPFLPLLSVGIVLGLFAICSALEWLGQMLFRLTFDKIDNQVIVVAGKTVSRIGIKAKEKLKKYL